MFTPFRNTLFSVVTLFTVYLGFEFSTLWFREFPANFYYAGYAHEGAAWLTIALALATALLSFMFRGRLLGDARLPVLTRLAWIWSVLNLLLAVAVYNRLWIYIRFNGMTRMRVVGLFGISAVVIGFVLVMIRIRRHYNFTWLVQRQLLALFCVITVYCVLPIDVLIHTFNVRQILQGDLAPSVQITEHVVDNDGCLVLTPLLGCDDSIIRNGIAALLVQRHTALHGRFNPTASVEMPDWTARQLADEFLYAHIADEMKKRPQQFAEFRRNAARRDQAWDIFREYAYQWY